MNKTMLRYGPDRAQVAELWRPGGPDRAPPVVALIHGGFWRQIYSKRLMHGMAEAVVAHGWVAYNIEYRRVGTFGHGGWPATFDDVSDAIEALDAVDGIDQRRVATCGHSAGGHLGLWAGSPRATGTPRRATDFSAGIRGRVPGWCGRSRCRSAEHAWERSGHRTHGR